MHADALAVGPDQNIWFVGTRRGPGQPVDVVGRSTPDGQIAEFALPARGEAELGISSIAAGHDGNLYFTEPNANRFGRISTAGEIFEFALPNPGSVPRTIVAAPDGALWFTEEGGDRVARFSPIVNAPRERQLTPGARPTGIAARADGTIWITEPGVDELAIVTTAGVSSFPIPFASPGPNAIVPGPEGNVWFTTGNRIGSISPDRLVAGPACLAAGCDLPVTALAAGPEGSLWYAAGAAPGDAGLAPGTIGKFLPPRVKATVSRRTGGLAGRYVKLVIACQGGAAGQFCRGRVQLRGRLGGKGKPVLLGSRGLEFHVHSDRDFPVRLSSPAAALLRREGRLSARVTVSLSGGRRTSGKWCSGRAGGRVDRLMVDGPGPAPVLASSGRQLR
jgi:virginiamycin B lyase